MMKKPLTAVLVASTLLSNIAHAHDRTDGLVDAWHGKPTSVQFYANATAAYVKIYKADYRADTYEIKFFPEGPVRGLKSVSNIEPGSFYEYKPGSYDDFDPPMDWPYSTKIFVSASGKIATGVYANPETHKIEFMGRSSNNNRKTQLFHSVPGKAFLTDRNGEYIAVSVFEEDRDTILTRLNPTTSHVVVINSWTGSIVASAPIKARRMNEGDGKYFSFIGCGYDFWYVDEGNRIRKSGVSSPLSKPLPEGFEVRSISGQENVVAVNLYNRDLQQDFYQYFSKAPFLLTPMGRPLPGTATYLGGFLSTDKEIDDDIGALKYKFFHEESENGDALAPFMVYESYFSTTKLLQSDQGEGLKTLVKTELGDPKVTDLINYIIVNDKSWANKTVEYLEKVGRLFEGAIPQYRQLRSINIPSRSDFMHDVDAPEILKVPTQEGHQVPVRYWKKDGAKGIIFDLHGGPYSCPDTSNWFVRAMLLQGWSVARPEPRGSDCFGLEYAQALRGRWGDVDVQDVMTVARHFKAQHNYSDLFVFGSSYGGFLALSLMAHPDNIFRAGATVGGVYDLALSERRTLLRAQEASNPQVEPSESDTKNVTTANQKYRLNNEIFTDNRAWHLRYGFNATEDSDRNAQVSPIYHVSNVSDPMLVIHGEKDDVVHPGQFHALLDAAKHDGRNFTGVKIHGEGHGFVTKHGKEAFLQLISEFFSAVLSGVYRAPSSAVSYYNMSGQEGEMAGIIDSFTSKIEGSLPTSHPEIPLPVVTNEDQRSQAAPADDSALPTGASNVSNFSNTEPLMEVAVGANSGEVEVHQ